VHLGLSKSPFLHFQRLVCNGQGYGAGAHGEGVARAPDAGGGQEGG